MVEKVFFVDKEDKLHEFNPNLIAFLDTASGFEELLWGIRAICECETYEEIEEMV